jgi:hypothetical protein
VAAAVAVSSWVSLGFIRVVLCELVVSVLQILRTNHETTQKNTNGVKRAIRNSNRPTTRTLRVRLAIFDFPLRLGVFATLR